MTGRELAAELAALWTQHHADTDSRLAAIDAAAAALLAGGLDAARRESARVAAHKLTGALGTYGMAEGSRLAMELEDLLRAAEAPPVLRVAEIATRLREIVASGPPGATSGVTEPRLDVAFATAPGPGTRAVVEAAERAGIACAVLASPDELERHLASAGRARLVVADTAMARWEDLLAGLAMRQPAVPTVVLAAGDALPDRALMSRLGARRAIPRDLPPDAVAAALREVLAEIEMGEPRILAVDDDPLMLSALTRVLAANGIQATTAPDATRFWAMLEQVAPDALVLDVEMPGIDGIDLCRALRAHLRWGHLPVLFLTSLADAEVERRAFAAGADDYLRKPISADDLASRIRNRLLRAGRLRDGSRRAGRAAPAAREAATTVDVAMIDDDPTLTALVSHALGTRGLTSRIFGDATSALASLAPAGDLGARVLLLDVDLPDLDGLAVLRRLAESGVTSMTRTIMLTVRASEREILEALELGAVDHVAKPFSVPILMQRIRLALIR